MRSDFPSWFGFPFARLWNRSAPNDIIPVAIVGIDPSQPQPTNVDLALLPVGNGALIARIPDGTRTGGNKRGTNAVDLCTNRSTAAQVASGARSVIGGGLSNTSSGEEATVAGGSSNTASGNQSTVAGGSSNTASGSGSAVGGGGSNTAGGSSAIVGGGSANSAGGSSAFVGGGGFNSASSTYATIGGGQGNVANSSHSTIPGGHLATTRSQVGRLSYASGATGGVAGGHQYGLLVVRQNTTNATATVLTSNGSATVATTNTDTLPDTSVYAFYIRVVCIQTGGTAGTVNDAKAWEVTGAIKRNASAATTALLGTPTITVLGADTNLGADNTTGAIIDVSANTTTGALYVTVTGEVDKNLRWTATIETTEADY